MLSDCRRKCCQRCQAVGHCQALSGVCSFAVRLSDQGSEKQSPSRTPAETTQKPTRQRSNPQAPFGLGKRTVTNSQTNRGSSAPHESQRKTEDGLVCFCRLTLCARLAAPVPPAPIDAPLRQGARQDGWCYLHGDPAGRPRGGNPTLAWSSQISGMERTRFPGGLLVCSRPRTKTVPFERAFCRSPNGSQVVCCANLRGPGGGGKTP